MATIPTRTTHAHHFRVADEEDVTAQGTTVSPRSLDIQHLDVEGARTTRVTVSGQDRVDGELSTASSHTVTIGREAWPEWVARRVSECAPEGWEE